MIHVDQRFPIFMTGGIHQPNPARETPGNIGPCVTVVTELHELNCKRFVEAFRSQHYLIILSVNLETCRSRKTRCEIPGADMYSTLPDRYGSSRHVAFVRFVGPFCFDRYSHRADLQMWVV